MNKVLRKLGEKKAVGIYFEVLIFVLIVVMSLVLIMTTVNCFYTKYKMDNFGEELARSVEISGDTNAVGGRISDLRAQYNMSPSITFSRTGHIGLNESFRVTLKQRVYLEIGGLVRLPVDLTSVASGASEVFWK